MVSRGTIIISKKEDIHHPEKSSEKWNNIDKEITG